MPLSKDLTSASIENILQDQSLNDTLDKLKPRLPKKIPLPPNLPRQTDLTQKAKRQRLETLQKHGASFNYIDGKTKIEDPSIFKGNKIGRAHV